MNMNDPFGRMSQRDENQYASLKNTFREAGIDTPAAAKSSQQDLLKRTGLTALAILLFMAAVALMSPAYRAIAIVLGAVFLLWLGTTTLRGVKMIRRYIAEEFGEKKT